MRVFLAVLVLIFSLQSLTKADDIRDFEIEGMSIGDSLLEYYEEEEIKKEINISLKRKHQYKNNFIDFCRRHIGNGFAHGQSRRCGII